ncbi:MAG TPA: hypothetical protein VK503_02175 [Candidatus Bathyarchaeia archaeon]|nr:hypothetical protein [Candidatus Bathyarchaeia archaeon]
MLRTNGKRVAVMVLLIIGVAGAGAIVTFSPVDNFIHSIGPVSVTETGIVNAASPFNSTLYLSSDVGSCRGPAGYVPCFGGSFSQARLFNCATAAASPSGCTQLVVSSSNPQNSFQITIWYPYVGHSNEPSWANCIYTDSGDPGQYYGAYCVSVSSTEFIVTEPAPPPL